MPFLVLLCEAATALFVAAFCVMLTSDGLRGPAFRIDVSDPVGRFLIRNVQCAFVLGYGTFFIHTAIAAMAQP